MREAGRLSFAKKKVIEQERFKRDRYVDTFVVGFRFRVWGYFSITLYWWCPVSCGVVY